MTAAEYQREWKRKNRDKLLAYRRSYRLKNKEKCLSRERDWRKRNPDRVSAYQLISRCRQYGLTPEDFDQMKRRQNNKCAICGKHTFLVIDHCHVSKKVRGLLCTRCNSGIGFLFTNNLCAKAMKYLASHNT